MLSTTTSANKMGLFFLHGLLASVSRMLSTTTSANKMGLFFSAVFAGFLFSRMLSTTTSANIMGLFFLQCLLASCFQVVEHDN